MLDKIKIIKAAAAAVAGTADVVTAVIDRAGYEGVIFVATIATANAGNYLKAQQGAAANMSDTADLTGTKTTGTVSGNAVALDLVKAQKRYLTATIVRGSSTATGDIYAILYNKNKMPVINTRVGYDTKTVVSPAEGTA